MQAHNTRSAAQALYRVFVLPALPTSLPSRPLLHQPSRRIGASLTPHTLPPTHSQHRPFSTSPPNSSKSRAPEPRAQKWDEEIPAHVIQLIDPETNTLLPETRTRFDILNSLDRKTHRLVQLSPDPDPAELRKRNGAGGEWVPVCKVVSKKGMYEAERRKKVQAREKVREGARVGSVKTLELNWAIDANDLGHRLERVEEFLSDGRRVEVVLAAKKRGRKATRVECEGVLKRIEVVVGRVQGAETLKALEGKVGGFATLVLQGRAPSAQAQVQRGSKVDSTQAEGG